MKSFFTEVWFKCWGVWIFTKIYSLLIRGWIGFYSWLKFSYCMEIWGLGKEFLRISLGLGDAAS